MIPDEEPVAYGVTGVGLGFVKGIDLAAGRVEWTKGESNALLMGSVVQARLVHHAVHCLLPDVQVGICPFYHVWELGGGTWHNS